MTATTTSFPSSPSPVVELPDGQVAVMLDQAALASLGLKGVKRTCARRWLDVTGGSSRPGSHYG